MFRTLYVTGLLCLLSVSIVFSADKHSKKADKFFKKSKYALAIPLYLKSLEKEKNPFVIQKLAHCYRFVKDYEEAERWYAEIFMDDLLDSANRFFYAQMLMQNAKYIEAKNVLSKYTPRSLSDEVLVSTYLKTCDSAINLSGPVNYVVVKNLTSLNTSSSEYTGHLWNNTLYFTSDHGSDYANFSQKGICIPTDDEEKKSKKQEAPASVFGWSGRLYEKSYRAQFDSITGYYDIYKLSNNINNNFNNGSPSYSPSNDLIYFTRNETIDPRDSTSNRKKIRSYISRNVIYSAQAKDTLASLIPFAYNHHFDYSVQHPVVSADGKIMIFSSDMPGGHGNFDLYYVKNIGNDGDHIFWSDPVNLGDSINTPGNEIFPELLGNDTLYFSSDGLVGIGGLDIYSVKLFDQKQTGIPVLMPSPINSSNDDFGITFNAMRNEGVFSSNRPGGAGSDDIYYFKILPKEYKIKIYVKDEKRDIPIENASVDVDIDGTRKEFFTDLKGYTEFIAQDKQQLVIKVQKKDFRSEYLKFEALKNSEHTVLLKQSLSFEIEGTVLDKELKTPLDSVTVRIINLTDNVERALYSDKSGRFFMELEKEKDYRLIALKNGYLSFEEPVVLSTKGKTKSVLFTENILMDKIVINKPIRVDNIYYDLAKWAIKPQAAKELDKLVSMMINTPEIKIELSSHTDSRGSDKANMTLSQKRAQSAVNYIVSKGISKDRIIAKGYGESQLLNACGNGIKCSEEEHQLNRRTEFKVIGLIDKK